MKDFRKLSIREQHAQFVAFVELYNVGNLAGYVDDKFKPSINLKLLYDQPITTLSKFGGLPIASIGFQFPNATNNHSAVFICQLDLRDLKEFPTGIQFKGDGILYIFGAFDESKKDLVLNEIIVSYSEGRDNLEQIALTPDLEKLGVFPETPVTFFEKAELPKENMSGWIEQTLTPEETEFESYLTLILEDRDFTHPFVLLRPPTHILPEYYERACTSYLKVPYGQWLNDRGQLMSDNQVMVDYGQGYQDSFQWRHLFEFSFYPTERFSFSNNSQQVATSQSGYTLMIPQEALEKMDFSQVVLVTMRIGQY